MCFYQRIDYCCGDWKWGNMKEQCPRETRTGETCGAKLSHIESQVELAQPCRFCTDIATKKRRLAKAHHNVVRWAKDSQHPASMAKCRQEIRELDQQIVKLEQNRASNKYLRPSGWSRTHAGVSKMMPVPSITGTFFPPIRTMSGMDVRSDNRSVSEYARHGTCV